MFLSTAKEHRDSSAAEEILEIGGPKHSFGERVNGQIIKFPLNWHFLMGPWDKMSVPVPGHPNPKGHNKKI